jgi:hypothetical protein
MRIADTWLVAVIVAAAVRVHAGEIEAARPRIASFETGVTQPPLYGAIYAEPKGLRLVSGGYVSDDNGRRWIEFQATPDFAAGLPFGYRRERGTAVLDSRDGRLLVLFNSLDTPGLDPKAIEPPISLNEYYLRYRVSNDGGRTWLFDERIIHTGKSFSDKHPFDGIELGKNSLFLGDNGCAPLVTQSGRILVPAQATILDADGKLLNPLGQTTFTDVFVILGKWQEDGRIEWTASPRVNVDVSLSTRGMIEPALAQFKDGRILMVMRGSNAGKSQLPGYRWFSISNDDGSTWSAPRPWTYDSGESFFSPSSMSVLATHSSGRVFWVGNISNTNTNGNDPRLPVVMGEVDPASLLLIRRSVLEVDTKRPEDDQRGRELLGDFRGQLDLSHFHVMEDRETHEFVVTYPRAFGGYVKSDWATVRVAVGK